jgi:hypothetical protein
MHIFQQTACTSETSKELVTKEWLICKCYQVDPKDIKCPLQWWGKHEAMSPIVCFLAHQILGIVRSPIETKRIFSLVGIFTNLRRCCIQWKKLRKNIFCEQKLAKWF